MIEEQIAAIFREWWLDTDNRPTFRAPEQNDEEVLWAKSCNASVRDLFLHHRGDQVDAIESKRIRQKLKETLYVINLFGVDAWAPDTMGT